MEYLKKIKEKWAILSGVFVIICSIFMFSHNLLNSIEDLKDTINTTKQMALKSVIWNEFIPDAERANVCDIYIGAGYNSMTKKECEIIIKRAEEKGSFSYVERR